MSDYPMLISNKLHSFRNFKQQIFNHQVEFCRMDTILLIVENG